MHICQKFSVVLLQHVSKNFIVDLNQRDSWCSTGCTYTRHLCRRRTLLQNICKMYQKETFLRRNTSGMAIWEHKFNPWNLAARVQFPANAFSPFHEQACTYVRTSELRLKHVKGTSCTILRLWCCEYPWPTVGGNWEVIYVTHQGKLAEQIG
jgi:hypothetical protein